MDKCSWIQPSKTSHKGLYSHHHTQRHDSSYLCEFYFQRFILGEKRVFILQDLTNCVLPHSNVSANVLQFAPECFWAYFMTSIFFSKVRYFLFCFFVEDMIQVQLSKVYHVAQCSELQGLHYWLPVQSSRNREV